MLYYAQLNNTEQTMYAQHIPAIAKHCSVAVSEVRYIRDTVYYIDDQLERPTLSLDNCIVYFPQILVGTLVIIEESK